LSVGAAGWSATALGGTAPDPNATDVVLGTAGGFRYAKETLPLGGTDHYNGPTAGCGSQARHVMGGGWLIKGAPPSGRKGESQQPVDYTDDVDTVPDEGWSSSGFASQDGDITAFAICEPDTTPAYEQVVQPLGSSNVRTSTLNCEPGTGHVIGGGVTIATVHSYTIASRPLDGLDSDHTPDDGWFGKVYDTIGGNGGFSAYSICQPGPVSYERAGSSVAAHHAAGATARCPGGKHVASGGGSISGPGAEVHLAGSYPVDGSDADHVPDDGWKSLAFNDSSAVQKLTAYAVCLA
jgi:hypothetical protein